MSVQLPGINSAGKHIPSYQSNFQRCFVCVTQTPVPDMHASTIVTLKQKDRERILNEKEINEYQNTKIQTILVQILEGGFWRAYCELYALWISHRDNPIFEDITELHVIMNHLIKAEKSNREDNINEEYDAFYCLACHFRVYGNLDFQELFFHHGLELAKLMSNESREKISKCHCDVGLTLRNKNEYESAITEFELGYDILSGIEEFQDNITYKEICENIATTRYEVAQQLRERGGNFDVCRDYLKKSVEKAKESKNLTLHSYMVYKLAKVLLDCCEPKEALSLLNERIKYRDHTTDLKGISKCYEAISEAYKQLDNFEKSLQNLEIYTQLANRSSDNKAIAKACYKLGIVYNVMGANSKAVEYLNQAYNAALTINSPKLLQDIKVYKGVALGNQMLNQVTKGICSNNLFSWKNTRTIY